MLKIMARLWDWLKGFFARGNVQLRADTNRKAAPKPRRGKQHHGAHYYLGDLLDRLDGAFRDFRAIRKADKDAYDLFSRVGVGVFSKDAVWMGDGDGIGVDNRFFDNGMPSFGCAYMGGTKTDEDTILATFLYIVKEKRPVGVANLPIPNVQATNGTVYRVGAVYKPPADESNLPPVSVSAHVAVYPDGSVKALKTAKPIYNAAVQRVRMAWTYPEWLGDVFEGEKSIDDKARSLLGIVATASVFPSSGLTVRVTHRKERLTFGIDMLRTPYFFRDRDRQVTENGATKKILHYVRGHMRTMAGGEKKFIAPHWRGLRRFTWNGYEVSIGMAGRHHADLNDFQAPAYDARDPEILGKGAPIDEVAEKLASALQ